MPSKQRSRDRMQCLTSVEQEATESLFTVFEKRYSEEIKSKINSESVYAELANRKGLSLEKVRQIVFEREMIFCRQMLDRLQSIIAKAKKTYPKKIDNSLALQLSTSKLYDIDHTIGADFDNIRPSAPFLFKFLKEDWDVKIGFCTTRHKETVERQLKDPSAAGSLSEVAEFLEKDLIFDTIGHIELDSPLFAIYKGYHITDTVAILKKITGWNDEKIDDFLEDELPELYRQDMRRFYREYGKDVEEGEIKKELQKIAKYRGTPSYVSKMLRLLPAPDKSLTLRDGTNFSELSENFFKALELEDRTKDNRETMEKQNRKIAEVLEVGESEVMNPLLRLSAAKMAIDKGYSFVSITVDNAVIAEKFDKLLNGEIKDEKTGKYIDGYALLNLEEYRDRLFIIHCGARGVYSESEIIEDVRKAA